MQTIRKSIYIGLGGTGVRAVAGTKKMFEDSFGAGNIPPQIAFVALDFDRSVIDDTTLATDISADFIQLPQTVNPFLIYRNQVREGKCDWMLGQNASFLPEYMDSGAGQVRSNGRFFTELVKPCVAAAINSTVARVLSLANQQNDYLVVNDDHVNVYLAMSLVGGTGSAMMISVAQMLKERYPRIRVVGYGLLHSIFNLMDPLNMVSPRVNSNAYASLLELDYVQSASTESPQTLILPDKTVVLKAPLFDEFFVVDNKSQIGGVVDNIQDLCNAIGCSMYYGGTDVCKNHTIDWRMRGLQWDGKVSWVHSFGVCQIVYKGEELAEFYGKMASSRIVHKMLDGSQLTDEDVYSWLDRACLREDGKDYDKLIDSICPPDKMSKVRLPELDTDYSIEELRMHITRYCERNSVLWENAHIKEIISKAESSLNAEVDRLISREGGVVAALDFLKMLDPVFVQYGKEMNQEAAECRKNAAAYEKSLNDDLNEYGEISRKFLSKLSGSRRRQLDKVSAAANRYVRETLQAKRRDEASLVFTSVINEVRRITAVVASLHDMLVSIESSYASQLRKMEKGYQTSSLFEIDLSREEMRNMTVSDEEITLKSFIDTLPCPLLEIDSDGLRESLKRYTDSLAEIEKYRNGQVMDVIEKMSEDEYAELKQTILRRSAPLLSLDDRGLVKLEATSSATPISRMMKVFYVCAYKERPDVKTRLEEDNKLLPGENVRVSFVPTDAPAMKQKVFIHRVDSAIMPYCIESLNSSVCDAYKASFKKQEGKSRPSYNPHSDADLYNSIIASGLQFQPEE